MGGEIIGHETVHPDDEPLNVEAEFANLVRYIDLYIRQKTDLFIQHYIYDPASFITRQVIYVSVLASLLVTGTMAIAIGTILFVSTIIPLWAALMIIGIISFIVAGAVAFALYSRKMVLKTPKVTEAVK